MLASFFNKFFGLYTSGTTYAQALRESWKSTAVFFSGSMVILGCGLALHFNAVTIPQIQNFEDQTIQEITTHYPSELKLNWDQQTLTSNQTQPIPIYFPSFIDKNAYNLPERFGYIYPENKSIEEILPQLPTSTLLVINQNSLFLSDTQGNWNQTPLNLVPGFQENFEITSATLPVYLENVKTYVNQSINFLRWASFIGLPLFLIGLRVWTTLLDSFVVFILIKLSGSNLSFTKVWQLLLHISIVAQTAELIGQVLYPQTEVPLFTITMWCLLFYVMWQQRHHFFPNLESFEENT